MGYAKYMKPGSSVFLGSHGHLILGFTELLSFLTASADGEGEELQSVIVSQEQLKVVQEAIREYLERTETEDIQSVEAATEVEPESVDTKASVLFDYLRWCNINDSLLRFDSRLAKRKIERYLEETAQVGSPKNETGSTAPPTDSKDVDNNVATLLNLVDWCREMSDAERYDKNVSYEEGLAVTKVVRHYILSNKWLEKVPKESISKLCVSIESVELEAPKVREATEAVQQIKRELTDIKSKRFSLNPDNVKITKSTCNPRKTSETVVGEGLKMLTFSVFDSHEYFAEITCNLFSLKVGGRSPEEAKANLDERFAELTQALFR